MKTLLCVLCVSVASFEARAAEPDPYRFWRPERRAGQRELEATLLAVPERASLRSFHDLVSSEPHVAGTAGDARVIDKLARALAALGLEVERQELLLYLPRPLGAEVEIVSPRRIRLAVREDVLPQDPWSADARIDIGWNAYGGSGEVEGGVVYANYGTKADFERLRALGVAVDGRIVVARYGGNFRGHKARFAQEAGAAGLIIYTDPKDGGFVDGPAYPEGGWTHPSAIQRGSILTLPYAGDPLTPFEPATPEARRLDPAVVDLPRIPVQPLGFRSAQEILSRMTGPPVPKEWQGGLPFTYRLTGGDGLRVRLAVRQERRLAATANVVGTLRGARFPEERVIVGSHHDAWTFGAADPNAGTIVVLEAARAFAEAARRGLRPDRSIVFANWGAEEFGILGSTEWVEARREELRRGAVAYVNLDSAALGLELTASASPSLKGLVAEVAQALPQPRDPAARTALEAWRARGEDPQRPGRPRMGDTGGGSDHVGFVAHLGVPVVGLGAQGSEGTAYHSAFDDLSWYRKVVGEDYDSALLLTRLTSLLLARLATSDVLPLDSSAYGLEARRHLADIAERARQAGVEADLVRADAAAQRFERRARRRLEEVLSRLEAGALDEAALDRANERIIDAERLWTAPEGVPERPWFRSLFAATDPDSGYAAWMLPALRWAIERHEAARVEPAERQLLAVFDRLEETLAGVAALDERVRAAIAGFSGKVSLFAKNLDTGETYGLGPDDRVRAASTIKVPVMVEAFARVESGEAVWTEVLPLTETGKATGAGVLPELHEGLPLTLRDAVRLMIVLSDNTATNIVLDRLTADAVNARMDVLGLGATRVLRKVGGGGESGAGRDPANRRFGLGVTTPREMVRLLEALERRQVVSPDASREMLEILKREQYGFGIGRTLRGVSVASKWGALERLRSDVGIVYSERGRIAMAITCEGIPEIAWTVDNPGDVLVSQLSLLLVDGLGRPAFKRLE